MPDLMREVGFVNLGGIDEGKVSPSVSNCIHPVAIGHARISPNVRHGVKHEQGLGRATIHSGDEIHQLLAEILRNDAGEQVSVGLATLTPPFN
ncbi:MAG: hypothetical protein ACOYON_10170 [Fimbriimonas sp.]